MGIAQSASVQGVECAERLVRMPEIPTNAKPSVSHSSSPKNLRTAFFGDARGGGGRRELTLVYVNGDLLPVVDGGAGEDSWRDGIV